MLTCPGGHGAWLQREQLARIARGHDADTTDAQERSALRQSDDLPAELVTGRFHDCPVCGDTLRKDDYRYGSGVVIDVCDEHGIWVDSGELERMEAWAEAMAQPGDLS